MSEPVGADEMLDRIEELELAVRYEADLAQQALDARKKLEAKLAEAREEGFWAGRSCGGAKKEIDAALAELKGQDNE